MKRILTILTIIVTTTFIYSQETVVTVDPEPVNKVAGYHIGVVQIIFATNKGNTDFMDESNFYSIGFPMGGFSAQTDPLFPH